MEATTKSQIIQAQILALQRELEEESANEHRKRKATECIRVPASPSPAKKRKITKSVACPKNVVPLDFKQGPPKVTPVVPATVSAQHSKLVSALTSFHQATESTDEPTLKRSNLHEPATSFGRNDDLTLAEELEPGPKDYVPPANDPLFDAFEPNSQINLKSRSFKHEDLQEFLRARFYVSPSLLYSISRLSSNRQGYEVPVEGDWVTIAVIAERGQISVSRGNAKVDSDSSDGDEATAKTDVSKDGRRPKKKKPALEKKGGKKYVTLKLVDFGRRSTDPHTGKVTIGGDALLNLILFESDSWSTVTNDDGLSDRIYRGGSGGAFETCARLHEGTVIAIMNPRILKPFQRGTDKPHRTNNILALTPDGAKSIVVIGQAKDLGQCPALKRDGKKCGSWCDRRVSDVCEYHVQRAVQSRRASRPEFATGTSGMSARISSRPDPTRKWGLLPPTSGIASGASKTSAHLGGGTTYVLPGLVISDNRDRHVSEVMGRDNRHDKKRRQAEKAAQDSDMQMLLLRDGKGKSGGSRSIFMAQEAAARAKSEAAMSKRKGKAKAKDDQSSNEIDKLTGKLDGGTGAGDIPSKHIFSATAIKRIGFNPSAKFIAEQGSVSRKHKITDPEMSQALTNLTSEKTVFKLGRRPGTLIRSGVFAPAPDSTVEQSVSIATTQENQVPFSICPNVDSDDDLEITST